MTVATAAPTLERRALPDRRTDRLHFAQVREDPRLEIEALGLGRTDTVVVVSSGGCTALSLLGAGAGRVVAVDQNATQNHLVELKAAAVQRLPRAEAIGFVGGAPMSEQDRLAAYQILRGTLSPAAQRYWESNPDALQRGVISAGVTERFIGLLVRAMRTVIHSPARIEHLLSLATLPEQQAFYRDEWDNRRWRAMFRVLLSRWTMSRVYDPAFFAHLEKPSFAEHFRHRAEYTLTQLPVSDNYFVHQMLTGRYPTRVPDGLPPYLTEQGAATIGDALDRLELVDSTYTAYLRGCEDDSVDAFVISNICEWLTPGQIDELFAEIVRTAAPGARLCFRNFVGWTEVPERWRAVVQEDRMRGEALMRRDRSVVQRRFGICRIEKEAA